LGKSQGFFFLAKENKKACQFGGRTNASNHLGYPRLKASILTGIFQFLPQGRPAWLGQRYY